MTPRQDDEVLVEELAVRIPGAPETQAILQTIGVSSPHVPPSATPAERWRAVLDAAAGGAVTGGTRAVIAAVAAQFPGNAVFERYLTSTKPAALAYATGPSQWSMDGLEARDSGGLSWPGSSAELTPDVGHEDHLWDTGGSASLRMLAPRLPTATRGPTIIVGGRVRHKQRPLPRCPDCDGALQPAIVSIRFELAPEATAAQQVPGHRCACGSHWPDPLAIRSAHAAAFGVNG